jgi:hypothetical protein
MLWNDELCITTVPYIHRVVSTRHIAVSQKKVPTIQLAIYETNMH